MSKLVREVMTGEPQVVEPSSTAQEAARLMREQDIGDVLVVDEQGKVQGILTDRDIVVRGVVTGADPKTLQVSQLYTSDPVTLTPDDTVEHAQELMRKHSVRRLPVVQGGVPVGIVSLGDVAVDQRPSSTLAYISSASPNGAGRPAKGAPARRVASALVTSLPIAAAGAGAAIVVERVSGRRPNRTLRVASRRLKRAGKHLRRNSDRIGSESAARAAEYAARASKELRRRGEDARRKARSLGRRAERRADATLMSEAAELVRSRR